MTTMDARNRITMQEMRKLIYQLQNEKARLVPRTGRVAHLEAAIGRLRTELAWRKENNEERSRVAGTHA